VIFTNQDKVAIVFDEIAAGDNVISLLKEHGIVVIKVQSVE